MARTDEHHDERYEDGEPLFSAVVAYAYADWFNDRDAYDALDPKHPDYPPERTPTWATTAST